MAALAWQMSVIWLMKARSLITGGHNSSVLLFTYTGVYVSFFECCVRYTVTCRNVIKSSLFTCCSQLLPQLLMGYRAISSPLGRICLAVYTTPSSLTHTYPTHTYVPHPPFLLFCIICTLKPS